MTLPASGQISFNDLRVELGISSQAPFSITSASTGLYVAINTNSPDRPNSSTPHAISEWYSYNHNASSATCYSVFNGGGGTSNTISWTDANGVPRTGTLASGVTTYVCSQVEPTESPAADVIITSCLSSCSEVCTSLPCGFNDCPC
jgi:hypothetical protein